MNAAEITLADLAVAAVGLARRGLAVFPLSPGTKVPRSGSNGFHDATTDPDAVAAIWAETPTANIGIATGAGAGFWALDIDPQHGGNESYSHLIGQHGRPPATVSVHTPSGGLHLWFRCPDGIEIRTNVAAAKYITYSNRAKSSSSKWAGYSARPRRSEIGLSNSSSPKSSSAWRILRSERAASPGGSLGWLESEVLAWIEARTAERDAA
jgi:hypothetical protein